MYFRNYRLGKRLLNKCLKNFISEDPSTSIMVNGSKSCCNHDGGTLTIFIDNCEHNSVEKCVF